MKCGKTTKFGLVGLKFLIVGEGESFFVLPGDFRRTPQFSLSGLALVFLMESAFVVLGSGHVHMPEPRKPADTFL